MQTIKRQTEFTGYIMCTCKCGRTSRIDVGIYAFRGFSKDGRTQFDINTYTVNCPECSAKLRVVFGKPLYGKFVKETICNSKCTSATGHNCECSCGGKNHGSNWNF